MRFMKAFGFFFSECFDEALCIFSSPFPPYEWLPFECLSLGFVIGLQSRCVEEAATHC